MTVMLTDAHQTLWTGSRQSLSFTAAALPLGALRDKKRPRRPMKLSAQAAGALSRYLFCTTTWRRPSHVLYVYQRPSPECACRPEAIVGLRPDIDAAIKASLNACLTETDLSLGKRTVVQALAFRHLRLCKL